MIRWDTQHSRGFTIVELLIVIVVIGILAAIVIVAFNGVQERARYTTMRQDIASLNKAIMAYHAVNDAYPYPVGYTGNYVVSAGSNASIAIPGLAPEFIAKAPQIPSDGKGGYYAYIASQNGANYKILRLLGTGPLPASELNDPGMDWRVDTNGNRRGWGAWSPGGSGL